MAEAMWCREPAAPWASPRSSAEVLVGNISPFCTCGIRNTGNPGAFPEVVAWVSVSAGFKGDLQSSSLSNWSECLLLIGGKYNGVER